MTLEEIWKVIADFPNYEVSNHGRIANVETDVLIQPSTTLQGGLKVGIYKNDKQYTRSVKRLVAEAFVEGFTEIFDTPVVLDGDQLNCAAYNLVWRPRWFAWQYAHQFKHVLDHYRLGPIVELDETGIVLGAYDNIMEVGTRNGLLFSNVWTAIHAKAPVFPTKQRFAFADKV